MTSINTPAPAKAQAMMDKLNTYQLIRVLDSTNSRPSSEFAEVAMVRGWILDELEKRDPQAMDEWLMSDDLYDLDALKYFCK